VAVGIWASGECAKLRRSDADARNQPPVLFQCHQADVDSAARRVCAGWSGCREGGGLLALRLAVLDGRMDPATYRCRDRVRVAGAPVASEVAAHSEAGIDASDEEAHRLIDKISRTRTDLVPESPGA
jgi:hypothetical protein